ncbi:MAG TPA: hypothetical protein VFM02_01065 [Candidatus Paceibacterota bacterium]|nr:hypothetical protein [Candidatus Paceibacterota bacterium]
MEDQEKDVIFEEDENLPQPEIAPSGASAAPKEQSPFTRAVMKLSGGAIKTEKQAVVVMVVFVVIVFLLIIWLLSGLGGPKPLTPEEIQQMVPN